MTELNDEIYEIEFSIYTSENESENESESESESESGNDLAIHTKCGGIIKMSDPRIQSIIKKNKSENETANESENESEDESENESKIPSFIKDGRYKTIGKYKLHEKSPLINLSEAELDEKFKNVFKGQKQREEELNA